MEYFIQFVIENWYIEIPLIISIAALILFEKSKRASKIEPQAATIMINKQKARVLDVRSAIEFSKGTIPNAVNVNNDNASCINALKGDIRVEPDDPGGKLFEEEDLSIYQNLDSDPKVPEKDKIILKNSDQNFVNLRKEITVNELIKGDQKNLTSAIEDALKEVHAAAEGKLKHTLKIK